MDVPCGVAPARSDEPPIHLRDWLKRYQILRIPYVETQKFVVLSDIRPYVDDTVDREQS